MTPTRSRAQRNRQGQRAGGCFERGVPRPVDRSSVRSEQGADDGHGEQRSANARTRRNEIFHNVRSRLGRARSGATDVKRVR